MANVLVLDLIISIRLDICKIQIIFPRKLKTTSRLTFSSLDKSEKCHFYLFKFNSIAIIEFNLSFKCRLIKDDPFLSTSDKDY